MKRVLAQSVAALMGAALLMACAPDGSSESPLGEAHEAKTSEDDRALMGVGDKLAATMPNRVPVPTQYMPEPAMLIFSDTWDWRHEEGIAGGNLALIEIAREAGMGYFTTQHGEIFNADSLARFDLVVFNSFTGDALTPSQEEAFEAWMAAGGAAILIHGAMDSSHKEWEWYSDRLIGPTFISHPMAPQFQAADIVSLTEGHPVMAGLPSRFSATDEWYTFDGVPVAGEAGEHLTVLAGLDESTYSPRNTVYGPENLRMGPEPEDHPIIWARCFPGGGRMVASALGHTIESFDADEHRRLLRNAIDWTRNTAGTNAGCE